MSNALEHSTEVVVNLARDALRLPRQAVDGEQLKRLVAGGKTGIAAARFLTMATSRVDGIARGVAKGATPAGGVGRSVAGRPVRAERDAAGRAWAAARTAGKASSAATVGLVAARIGRRAMAMQPARTGSGGFDSGAWRGVHLAAAMTALDTQVGWSVRREEAAAIAKRIARTPGQRLTALAMAAGRVPEVAVRLGASSSGRAGPPGTLVDRTAAMVRHGGTAMRGVATSVGGRRRLPGSNTGRRVTRAAIGVGTAAQLASSRAGESGGAAAKIAAAGRNQVPAGNGIARRSVAPVNQGIVGMRQSIAGPKGAADEQSRSTIGNNRSRDILRSFGDRLARQASLPPSAASGFDTRLGPDWHGVGSLR